MSRIEVEVEDGRWRDAVPAVRTVVRRAAQLAAGAKEGPEIAILLTNDGRIAALNAQFRGKDEPTNVLSFPAPHASGVLGDVALAFDVCEREAREQKKRLTDHVRHLVIHGVLHLRGYDHETETDAVVMEGMERRLLARLCVPDPYASEATE